MLVAIEITHAECGRILDRLDDDDRIAEALTRYSGGKFPATPCSADFVREVCGNMANELRVHGRTILSTRLRQLIFRNAIEDKRAALGINCAVSVGEMTMRRPALMRAS